MPKLKPRVGIAAIEEAAAAKGGGNFRPFVPELRWKEDGEKKYILVLTPIDEVATLELHEWVPIQGEKANGETFTRYESFLSRKDPMVGEDYDDISERLERAPKTRCYGVAVELEPVLETVKGRQRPKGFTVKTTTFTRKTDDGEQEMTQPVIGLIVQSAALMWSPLGSLDESQGPLSDLAIEVTRRGTDRNTRYDFVPFVDAPVDFSPIIEHLDGISYLNETMDDVVAAVQAANSELEAAQAVAEALYDRRLEELANKDRYEELVTPIEEIKDRFGGSKKGGGNSRPARPARTSPRAKTEDSSETSTPAADEAGDKFAKLKARFEQ